MSKQVRFRRGTTANHSTFTGAEAEITVDTTKNQVVVHDGATVGGVPLLREDRPRGFTRMEFITSTPYNWTQTGKTDLKRIRVTAYGGGGGGGSSTGGGGAGGIGFVTLEASAVTTNVTVTIGAGGAVGASGGNTSFGAYIVATGGAAGTNLTGGNGGSASGTGVYILGGQGGSGNRNFPWGGFPAPDHPGANNQIGSAQGGGLGGGAYGVNANGVLGGGGGGSAAGAQGCVIVEEIYGFV